MGKSTRLNQPDFNKLRTLINELAVRKGDVHGLSQNTTLAEQGLATHKVDEISYRRLAEEAGKSSTLLYSVLRGHSAPSFDTLISLANLAGRDPKINHLADPDVWLQAAGMSKNVPNLDIGESERKIITLLSDMTDDEKAKMFAMMQSAKQLMCT